jgi:hypothetical protein
MEYRSTFGFNKDCKDGRVVKGKALTITDGEYNEETGEATIYVDNAFLLCSKNRISLLQQIVLSDFHEFLHHLANQDYSIDHDDLDREFKMKNAVIVKESLNYSHGVRIQFYVFGLLYGWVKIKKNKSKQLALTEWVR